MSVDVWPGKHHLAMMTGIDLQVNVKGQFYLDASYSDVFVNIHDAPGSGDYMSPGNPTIGFHVVSAPSPDLRTFAGSGVTIPVLSATDPAMAGAAAYGARIRGYSGLDRFLRDHVALYATGGLEWHPSQPLLLRAETRSVVLFPIDDELSAIPRSPGLSYIGGWMALMQTDLLFEAAVEAEARTDVGLGVGLRLQGVFMPFQEDLVQTAMEPYLAFSPQRSGFFMRVGALVALDPDLGFGFSEDKLATGRLSIGLRL